MIKHPAAFALAALFATYSAAASPEADVGRTKLAEALRLAQADIATSNCQGILRNLQVAIALPNFSGLPEEQRARVHAIAASCAQALGLPQVAYDLALAGTKLSGAPGYLWSIRADQEASERNFAAAVATIEALAVQSPETLNDWRPPWIASLNREVGKLPDKRIQGRLLAVLTSSGYQPHEAIARPDGYKYELALIKLNTGDIAAAKRLMADVDVPYFLARASVDPRLSPLLPAGMDIRAAAERRLAQAREVAASHPTSMAAVLDIARYLRMLGRAEEALATVEAARPVGQQVSSFDDLQEQLKWWWDSLAECHNMLGHYDEAVAAYRTGAEQKEDGMANVSQALNLAALQLYFDHPDSALETLAPFDKPSSNDKPALVSTKAKIADKAAPTPTGRNMSAYGEMVYREIHGGAKLALGQADEAQVDISYAAAHEKDRPQALMHLQILAGNMDAAAETLIRRLDDPDRRVDALLELSDFDDPPVRAPSNRIDIGLKALKQRPDVKSALARAGGIRRFHIQAGMV